MAYPKRRKGFRPIRIDGGEYLWRFAAGPEHGQLVAQSGLQPGQRLTVILRGWRDPLLAASAGEDLREELVAASAAGNDPKVITPRFAGEAIRFALAHGWEPDRRSGLIRLEYRDGDFYAEGALPASGNAERRS